MKDFFELYDILIDGMDTEQSVTGYHMGKCWTAVETGLHFGMAMTTASDTAPWMLHPNYTGMPLQELAQASKSWNLKESSFGMAAINAYYNTPARLKALGACEPFENYCTDGLVLQGKRIGVIGHMHMPEYVKAQAEAIWILERHPHPGDYPDSACDWIIPQCDIVIITASALINKTLPHLLELCRNAYTILTGPSCPMCPELLQLGIDRLAGLVITDRCGMKNNILQDISGSPYSMGIPFLLTKNC